MKLGRYNELSRNEGGLLKQEEYEKGYHYCPEWDGLFIGPVDQEFDSCLCYRNKEDLIKEANP